MSLLPAGERGRGRQFFPFLLAALVCSGCTADQLAGLGQAAGVSKPAESITLPLQQVRDLEETIYQAVLDDFDYFATKCEASKKPGAACKLPVKDCELAEAKRAKVVEMHLTARRILDQPYSQVDVAGVIRLIGQIVGVAKEIRP